jgi:DNA-binding transcriptional LysR family regulator
LAFPWVNCWLLPGIHPPAAKPIPSANHPTRSIELTSLPWCIYKAETALLKMGCTMGKEDHSLELSLLSLKVFLRVAESRSFTSAAETLFLSQPTVSFHVQKVEQLFRTPLFVRSQSDRIRLTEAGKTLQRHAVEMIRLQQLIASDMKRHVSTSHKELRIGVCSIVGEHLVPFGVTAFGDKYPDVSLSLSVLKCEKVFNGLLEGNLDVGITGIPPRARTLVKTSLIRTPLILFKSGNGQKKISHMSVCELLDHSLILREKGSGPRMEFEHFLTHHGVDHKKLTVLTESESNAAIKRMVRDGNEISILPDFMVREEINSGVLDKIEMREGHPMQEFFLVSRKQDISSSTHMKDFINFLLKYAKK